MNNFREPVNQLVQDGKRYVEVQLDSVKLRSIKGLSQGFSTVASLLLIFILGSVFVLALSFALVMWLGELMGSYVIAAFIVSGVLLLALVACILLRGKLFRNTFVGAFRCVLDPSQPLKENTLEGVDAALQLNQLQVDAAEEGLFEDVEQIKTLYTPKNLLNQGLQEIGNRTTHAGFSFGHFLIKKVRDFVRKK